MADQFDVMVLGGGPGGYVSAIAAAKGGRKVVLFENDKLGGTCLNVGCIPTKYLLDKAAAIEKIIALTEKGVFKDAGYFNFKNIQKGKEEVVQKLVGGVAQLLKANGVTVVQGEAKLLPGCKAVCDGKTYSARDVIIATGSEPVRISIPGAEHTITSTELLNMSKLPERLAVIGGGVIGLELASAFVSFGSEVTIIELMDSLLPSEQPEAAKLLTSSLKKHDLNIMMSSKVERVENNSGKLSVVYTRNGQQFITEADAVLMAIGRKARLSGIDAQALGLKLTEKGFINVDKHMRTNVDHVYAIGDVAGGYQLAHVAYAEGETAAANILGQEKSVDISVVPRCVYTIPCFAAVGMTVAQAEEKGLTAALGSFSYQGNGMALAEGASGTVFAIMNKDTKEVLGIQIVGENASELISFAAATVAKKMKVSEWEDLIVAHPSLSEMVREAALDAFGKAIHKL